MKKTESEAESETCSEGHANSPSLSLAWAQWPWVLVHQLPPTALGSLFAGATSCTAVASAAYASSVASTKAAQQHITELIPFFLSLIKSADRCISLLMDQCA